MRPGPRTASPPSPAQEQTALNLAQLSGSRRTEIRLRKQILVRTIRRKREKKAVKQRRPRVTYTTSADKQEVRRPGTCAKKETVIKDIFLIYVAADLNQSHIKD